MCGSVEMNMLGSPSPVRVLSMLCRTIVKLAPTIVKLLSEDKSFIAVMMNTRALTHRIDMISCSFARTTSLVTSYSLSLVLGTR